MRESPRFARATARVAPTIPRSDCQCPYMVGATLAVAWQSRPGLTLTWLRRRRMGRDKAQHLPPGVGGCFGKLLVAAIEEAMCRAGVDNNLIVDAGSLDFLLELMHLLYRDALVSAAEEAEQGIPFLRADFQYRS